jgi:16S rRNA (uracil1498-N3)-methyltransferase
VAAHVIVGSLPGSPELDPDAAHHLASVLRLRPGEAVGATDGRGGYLPCVYAGPGRLEPTGPVVQAQPRQPLLTVGFVPVKGDRPEWVVQKLTELGVDRVIVLQSERSVVRWAGPRAGSHMQRLEKVARSAVMQSRQVWMPAVEGPVGLAEFLRTATPAGPAAGSGAGAGPAGPGSLAVAQMDGPPPWPGLRAVAVGPEGGWAPAELDAAPAAVGLGPSVLRAETAAVAAGVLLTALRSGTVSPGPGPRP